MGRLLSISVTLLLSLSLSGTTLEKLSLDEMVQKSTAVVRARPTGSSTVLRGSMIYTVYRLQISEVLKGPISPGTPEVYVPGGTYGRYRQSISGAPVLEPGVEYVLFLWTSPRGLVQVIGLSQGVFEIRQSATGEPLLVRGRIDADFVDSGGRAVADAGMRVSLGSLREALRRASAAREAQ
jgi:hypothetical protein